MRKSFGVLAIGALVVAGHASAATLSSASFGFQWLVGALPPLTVSAVGATGSATSNLSASLAAGTAFNATVTTIVPTSAAPPLTAIQLVVTQNAGGTLTGTAPGNVGGSLAFEGLLNVYGIGAYPTGGAPLLAVPLKIGTPSTITQASGGVALTAVAGPWTAGTAVVTGVGTHTSTPGTATAMGANALTPNGAGTLVLVSPMKLADGVAGYTAAFGTLTLTYVPEPGTLLLLGVGVVSFAAFGRRRR